MRVKSLFVVAGLVAALVPADAASSREDHCIVKVYSRPEHISVGDQRVVTFNGSTTGLARCTTGVEVVPAPLYPGASVAFAQLEGVPSVGDIHGVFTGSKLPGPVAVTFKGSGPGKYQSHPVISFDPTRVGNLTVIAYHPTLGELSATYTGTP